jgi:Ca-activated chloride channel family protein
MTLVLAALLNGGILSALVSAAVWLGLRVIPRRGLNAATRYVVWCATLVVAVTLPLLYLQLAPFHPVKQPPAQSVHDPAGSTLQAASPVDESVDAVETTRQIASQAPSHRSPMPVELAGGRWPEWIVSAWIVTTTFMLVRLSVSCVVLGRRKARASAAPARLAARAEEWLARCGSTRRRVRLAVSSEIHAPMVAGLVLPTILIPIELLAELEESELDQIGLHEAAHLARGDDYALICQRVLEALFALHPVVRWITRRIDLEREISCDDFVIQTTGDPRPYAACLTHVVELTGGVRASLVASAATEERSHLATRVEMLLDKSRCTAAHLLKAPLAALCAALAALTCTAAKMPATVAFAIPPGDTLERVSTKPIPVPPLPPRAEEPSTPQSVLSKPQPPASRTETALILIPVTVRDPLNRFVTGLDKDNFKVFEDDVEQQVEQFSTEDAAISAGIVFDASASVDWVQAVTQFFRTYKSDDEYLLVKSNDRPELISGLITNIDEIRNTLAWTPAMGKKAPLDAIYVALNAMKKARNPRKALLVISDGVDNNSRYTQSEITNLLREADVPVYAISIDPAFLREATEQTGGRHFAVDDLDQLPNLATKISIELRNQYVLGYRPKNATRDGNYRRVQVELIQPRGLPPLTATFRSGYYASTR